MAFTPLSLAPSRPPEISLLLFPYHSYRSQALQALQALASLWLELSQGLLSFSLLFASEEKVVWQWWVRGSEGGFHNVPMGVHWAVVPGKRKVVVALGWNEAGTGDVGGGVMGMRIAGGYAVVGKAVLGKGWMEC